MGFIYPTPRGGKGRIQLPSIFQNSSPAFTGENPDNVPATGALPGHANWNFSQGPVRPHAEPWAIPRVAPPVRMDVLGVDKAPPTPAGWVYKDLGNGRHGWVDPTGHPGILPSRRRILAQPTYIDPGARQEQQNTRFTI